MISSREARKSARTLFRECFTDGVLDAGHVRATVEALSAQKPRGFLTILHAFSRLVRLELERRHAVIESAIPLAEAELSGLRAEIARAHGADLTFAHTVRPELIGGLRIRVGSDVWDGSIRGRLAALPS